MRKFDKNNIDWGFSKLIKQKDLYKKNKNSNFCLVENDKCVIGVYIHVYGEGKGKNNNINNNIFNIEYLNFNINNNKFN